MTTMDTQAQETCSTKPQGLQAELPERKTNSRRTKRMQRNAAAVSTVRSGRKLSGFAERRQLAEGGLLMRVPLCDQTRSLLLTHGNH